MTVEDLVREGHIAKHRSLVKTVGDLFGESEQSADQDLLSRLTETERAYESAWNLLVSCKQKVVAGLSPSARAAVEVVGGKADLQVKRLGVVRHELQKQIAASRAQKARGEVAKGFGEKVAQLQKFREYARAVVDSKVKLGETDRRRLGVAISILELEVRESMP